MAEIDDERSARRMQVTGGAANPALPAEEVTVTSHRVACDGFGGALGHPRVYIELGGDGIGECGYCDRRFILAGSPAARRKAAKTAGVYETGEGH
jgi:uncharacterized Zn-finger protein